MLPNVRFYSEVAADTYCQYGSLFVKLSSLDAFHHLPSRLFSLIGRFEAPIRAEKAGFRINVSTAYWYFTGSV